MAVAVRRRIGWSFCLLVAVVAIWMLYPSYIPQRVSQDSLVECSLRNGSIQRDLEMRNYTYPDGKYNVFARRLDDLVPEAGGNPMRSVIMSTWRSGSSFMGEVISSQPSSFFHFEPLQESLQQQIGETSPNATEAVSILQHLLHCNYTGLNSSYLAFKPKQTMNRNYRLWNSCGKNHELCWNADFLTRFCRLFPFQTMKVVRLRLILAAKLLVDDSLNVRMILLVRDPRGTINSRLNMTWCKNDKLCSDPLLLCSDLVEDYWTAHKLRILYPHTFRVLRYEDFSSNAVNSTRNLFEFLGLSQVNGSLHEDVLAFLGNHTKENEGGNMSINRNTKETPFNWTNKLKPSQIQEVQSACKEAMHLWGYKEMDIQENGTQKPMQNKDFNPVGEFVWA